ncbi:MFS transporter [Haloparvum sedimenti]|uniref:MFS transporter n=1 Tax=Haloparvum sedimenti TaxID=1678448 RepID=UPI00071E9860|nr:MFS transporter [Haloparvum sedimenti]
MALDPRRRLADRVYYGWVVVVACFLASMATFGSTYAFGVFYDSLLETFDASRTALAAAFGLQTALIYVAGVGAGRVVETQGGRRVAAGSGALLAGGLAWTAVARSYAELLVAFGVVAATGMAGLYVVGYATVPRWFGRRRGTAVGVASAGLGVGLVAVPAAADRLIAAVGWRPAMAALAATVGVVAALVALLFADDPADVGAEAGERAEFSSTGAGGDLSPSGVAPDAGATLRSPAFLLVIAGWTLTFAPLYVVLSHVVLHASDAGLGRAAGVAAITTLGIATTVTRFGIGALSDRVGRTRTFVLCAVLMGVATAGFAVAPGRSAFLAVAVAFGVAYGGCGGLLGAQIADLFGEGALNTLFPVASLSFGVAGLAAPPAAGAAFEALGSYEPVLLAGGAAGLAGAGCVALAGRLAGASE